MIDIVKTLCETAMIIFAVLMAVIIYEAVMDWIYHQLFK